MQTDAMLCDRDQMTVATTSNMSKDAAAVIKRVNKLKPVETRHSLPHTCRNILDTGVLLMFFPGHAEVISLFPPVWYLVVNCTLSQGRAAVQVVVECPAVSVPRASTSRAVHRPPVQSGSAARRTAVIMTSHSQLSRLVRHPESHQILFDPELFRQGDSSEITFFKFGIK